MEPTEALAVLVALVAGFLTGRRSAADGEAGGFAAVMSPVRAAGRLAADTAVHIGSAGTALVRDVAAGAGDLSALALDVAQGAASGAAFGLIQFRAARHLRTGPPGGGRAQPGEAGGSKVIVEPEAAALEALDEVEAPERQGDVSVRAYAAERPVVLVTRGTRFHRPGCSAVRGDAREVGREDALAEGRIPCRSCNP
ncbi:MAG: hypothetical protein JOZ99_01995 [Actinobacteria bacterium]|nr:hypothetical protein [Actinomycetota bacterium]